MANIVVSAFSNVTFTQEKYHDSFVQGFINSLIRCGNNVLPIRVNDYINPYKNQQISKKNKKIITAEIEEFNPDVIITFNNMFPCEEFVTKTNCPIVLYTSDDCDFFGFTNLIEKYRDRYVFLNISESICNNLKEFYPFIKDSQFCEFGHATDFKRLNINQDINLSFLGSIPCDYAGFSSYFSKSKSNEIKSNFITALKNFKQNPLGKFDLDFDDKIMREYFKIYSPETLAVFMLTTQERFEILSNLCDLGLSIYGYDISFINCGMYNWKILDAYNFDTCVTQEQAELLYNRSKIAINLPSVRATTGFSWRVPDILASQSVLLTNKTKDLNELLKGYVDLPKYESAQEAKDIAQKFLKDDKWREEISLACNKMIEDKCRFEPKIKNLGDFLKINFVSDEKGKECKLKIYDSIKKEQRKKKFIKEASKTLPYFVAIKILRNLK